ncbi:hypothetical protein L208DRAFT_1399878 [Tricholoma matsutake]|nr:hypothetical protein L208DRAFT_1399878 [Tricholoma matsutake 945]
MNTNANQDMKHCSHHTTIASTLSTMTPAAITLQDNTTRGYKLQAQNNIDIVLGPGFDFLTMMTHIW